MPGRLLQEELVSAVMLWLSKKPERCRMKRLTELLNLIAALIRLADVIGRTGWF
jgi:hypothetical protein